MQASGVAVAIITLVGTLTYALIYTHIYIDTYTVVYIYIYIFLHILINMVICIAVKGFGWTSTSTRAAFTLSVKHRLGLTTLVSGKYISQSVSY